MDNKTAVYLSEEEQSNFVRYMKYQHILKELDAINFNQMKNGSIELHKDRFGNLSAVIQHVHTSFIYVPRQ